MPRLEHNKLVEEYHALSQKPDDKDGIVEWVKAKCQLDFLRENAHSREVVVYASSKHLFICSLLIPNQILYPLNKDELLEWSFSVPSHAASYVSSGGREGYWVEHNASVLSSETLEGSKPILYYRSFDGWNGQDRTYFEIAQEYCHLKEIHWRPEQNGYCKYDENGDLISIVSITNPSTKNKPNMVSFERRSLETYLTASDQTLVQFFDFSLLDYSNFTSWSTNEELVFKNDNKLIYKQKNDGLASYTRGFQIIKPLRTKPQIWAEMNEMWSGKRDKNHLEFIAYDWRNQTIRKISTDPDATTNYFQAEDNNLPFEVTPAFFKPEVLLKYKADKDKYTIGERDIRCRATWELRAFDVNEAGQIFAYICYLRNLPQSELLHWLSYNEEPKAPISKRALINDFEGRFTNFSPPLVRIKRTLQEWADHNNEYWIIRDERLHDHVNMPYTASRDEWGESFLALTKLVHEGFQVKIIHQKLDENNIAYNKEERSLALLEKLIKHKNSSTEPFKLDGLRTAQLIRSKVKGHSSGSDAENLSLEAIKNHENYNNHFQFVCEKIYEELRMIEGVF